MLIRSTFSWIVVLRPRWMSTLIVRLTKGDGQANRRLISPIRYPVIRSTRLIRIPLVIAMRPW